MLLSFVVFVVIPLRDEMGKYISDRDVVRICSTDELGKLLDKFSTRDLEVDAELMSSNKGNSLGAALYVASQWTATVALYCKVKCVYLTNVTPLYCETE